METQIQTSKDKIDELEAQIASLENSKKDLEFMFEKKEGELQEVAKQFEVTRVIICFSALLSPFVLCFAFSSVTLLTLFSQVTLDQTKEQLTSTVSTLELTKEQLEEHKVAVAEKEKTEETLLTRASVLLDTLSVTVGDVEGLHSKIGTLCDIYVLLCYF